MCWILICKPNKEGRGQGSYSMSNTHFAIAALRCCCCCCFYLCCRCTSSDQVSHQIEQRAQHAAINAGAIRCSAFFVARLVGQSLCRSVALCCVCAAAKCQQKSRKVALICLNCQWAKRINTAQCAVDTTNGQAIDMPMNHQSLQSADGVRGGREELCPCSCQCNQRTWTLAKCHMHSALHLPRQRVSTFCRFVWFFVEIEIVIILTARSKREAKKEEERMSGI